MTGALTAAAWTLANATTKKSSGISPIIIIYAVIAAGFYFLYYRPRKRKAQAAREQGAAWEVGDEVLTAGGIVGYIIDIDGDRVTLETSVGASFVVLKQYVLRKIEPVVPVDDDLDDDLDDVGDEHEDDEHEDDEHEDDDHDDEVDDEVDPDHDADHADDDELDEDGTGDHDETGSNDAEPTPGAGNRRARRRGLRPKATEVDDPGGDDAPPII
jgi:preprotein translocase subunit YajC